MKKKVFLTQYRTYDKEGNFIVMSGERIKAFSFGHCYRIIKSRGLNHLKVIGFLVDEVDF